MKTLKSLYFGGSALKCSMLVLLEKYIKACVLVKHTTVYDTLECITP